jgi:hypothetical protein
MRDRTFIDEEHELRLRRFADRVEILLRAAGLPVRREGDPWTDGAFVVKVDHFRASPGVYAGWYAAVAWHRQIHEYVVSGASDHPEVVRYRQVDEAMDQALVRIIEAFGLTTQYREYEDWAGIEILELEEEES